jgi:glyoxylase-like metal-dependent hydrolase (beta-lactamase superfamily II)
MALVHESFPVGPLQCNCTVIGDPESGRGIVIDPGGDPEKILAAARRLELSIEMLVHTHAHFDHILAAGTLRTQTGAPIHLHRDDLFLWNALRQQCELFGVPYTPLPPPDAWLEHEQTLPAVAGACVHTPGHTPGSISFHFAAAGLLVAGDTLFRGSVGRTDLPGGSTPALIESIQQRLYTLDEATEVITGHGPATTIGYELRNNAYVAARR